MLGDHDVGLLGSSWIYLIWADVPVAWAWSAIGTLSQFGLSSTLSFSEV